MKNFLGLAVFRRSMLPLLVLAGVAMGFLALWRAPVSWAQKKDEITILHTNNVTGHLFGCPT